ncbi:MAG: hypothetical protein WC365_09990 [Candidatus Babeliales bacterium]|jgi:hypothetical protein
MVKITIQDCGKCPKRDNKGNCQRPGPCIYVEKLADGNDPSVEPLIEDGLAQAIGSRVSKTRAPSDNEIVELFHEHQECEVLDYKDALAEISAVKADIYSDWHNKIVDMPCFAEKDLIRKCTCALLYFNIKIADIMRLLKLKKDYFYRLFNPRK